MYIEGQSSWLYDSPELLHSYQELLPCDGLRSLSFVHADGHCPLPIFPEHRRFISMKRLITANIKSLIRLAVAGNVLWACDMPLLSNIVDMILISPKDLSGLPYLFTHCTQMQSFTLHVDSGECDEFSAILHNHSDAFPLLKSCKLRFAAAPSTQLNVAAEFLRKKPFLECLDFKNAFEIASGSNISNEPVLKLLSDLPHLRVFGCSINQKELTPDHLRRLCQYIPPQLNALALTLYMDESTVTEADWEEFVGPVLFRGPHYILTSAS